jgi:hypothetical protein
VIDPQRLRQRDRGLLKVKVVTVATAVAAIAAGGAVGEMVATSYAKAAVVKPTPRPAPPTILNDAAPVQHPPPTPQTITKVVHVQSAGTSGYIQAPARGPSGSSGASGASSGSYAAPPPPAPAPACVSTPSRPC